MHDLLNNDAYDNAIYIIYYFSEKGKEVSYQKLNRLLYLLENIYMVAFNKDSFFDDNFLAYNFEINNKKISDNFKKFYNFGIELNDRNIDIPDFNKELIKVLFNIFGNFSIPQLVSFTTRKNSPWNEIFLSTNGNIDNNTILDKQKSKEWFQKLVNVDNE